MLPQNTIDILKTLSKTELKSLGDFINSPYFNSIEKLKDLYNEISKSYPDFTGKKLEDKAIHKKLYPGKEFKQKSVLNLFSEFGNLLKKFLSFEKFAQQEDAMDLNLVKSLSERRNYELSNKVINDFKKRKKSSEKFHEDHFYYFYKMDKVYYRNLINSRPLNKKKINEIIDSGTSALMLDFLSKYSSMAYILSLMKIIRPDDENDKKIGYHLSSVNPEDFLKYIHSSEDKYAEIIKMQYLFYKYTKGNSSNEDYYAAKDILLRHVDNFTPEDLCIYFKNLTDMAGLGMTLNEVFDVRKKFCDLKIYPNDSIPRFSAATLQNTFMAAMGLGEYEWAENFLEEYINYIDEDYKENEYNYSKAQLNLRMKRHEESLKYLNKINYNELVEKVNVRFYYLMNYIELDMLDAAVSMIKSVKQLLRDNTVRVKRDHYATENSLKFFNEIIKALLNNSKLDIAIYKEAEKEPLYYFRYYIIEKMKQMI
jgi:hypothetical protein